MKNQDIIDAIRPLVKAFERWGVLYYRCSRKLPDSEQNKSDRSDILEYKSKVHKRLRDKHTDLPQFQIY